MCSVGWARRERWRRQRDRKRVRLSGAEGEREKMAVRDERIRRERGFLRNNKKARER
jgi:hypothetical protein